MKVNYYCLLLDKYRQERYLKTKKESFDPNNISIIESLGIDGSKFKSSQEIAKRFDLKLGDQIEKSSPIIIAIAESHRKIWKKIIDSNSNCNIIFEDDIIIESNNFTSEIFKIKETFEKLKDPKILSIGYLYAKKEYSINDKISKTSQFAGLQSYLITKETAKYLYQNTFFLNNQIDTIISDTLEIDKYCLNIPIVKQKDIASIAHNQRYILLEYYDFKFLSKRIGINFKLNIGSGYHINFTYYTILNIITSFFLRLFFKYNQWIIINYFIFYVIETFIYGGVNWIDYDLFRGLNQISRYDDDEVVNKFIDFLLFTIIYLI